MPEPTSVRNTSVGSWFITGLKDDENGMSLKDGNKDGNNEQGSNQLLLHRMFEKFVEKTTTACDKEDIVGNGKNGEHPALIEYLEGVNTEDMKTISYKDLNEQSNRLARILIRKLESDIEHQRIKENKDGDFIVALRFLPGIELVMTILALIKAGLAYVPIAPNWPDGRIKMLLEDCQPIWALTNIKADPLYNAIQKMEKECQPFPRIFQICDLIQSFDSKWTMVDEMDKNIPCNRLHFNGKKSCNDENSLSNDRLFAILYTSGSTGIPKGARILHTAAINRLKWQWEEFPYKEGDVCAFKTTLTFVDSISEIFGPLLKGLPLVIIPKRVTQNVESFVHALQSMKITRIFAITSLIRNVLTYLEMQQKKTRCIIGKDDNNVAAYNEVSLHRIYQWECSAEAVTLDLVQHFFKVFSNCKENQEKERKICNFYGSTEMSDVTFAAFQSVDDLYRQMDDKGKVPIGNPVLNSVAYILDDKFQPVDSTGKVGQLFISSPNVAKGYCGGNTEARGFIEAEKLVKTFDQQFLKDSPPFPGSNALLYKTGDYARIYNDKLYYYGRSDSQIKVRGHRMDLTEIEKCVLDIPVVDRVSVMVYKPYEPTQKILCYFTLKSNQTNNKTGRKEEKENGFTELSLKEKLKTVLPEYMMPNTLIKLKGMPLLVNGKTDRQKLLTLYEDSLRFDFTFSDEELAAEGSVNRKDYEKARVLLGAITKILGFTEKDKPSLMDNFFDIGGDSLNMVQVIGYCAEVGYMIGMTEFAIGSNIADLVNCLRVQSEHSEINQNSDMLKLDELKAASNGFGYTSEEMNPTHKDVVIDMISRSFADKGDLTTLAQVTYDVLFEQVTILWESLLNANLSFVIADTSREHDDQIIGACLNFDARSAEAEPLCAISAATRANVDTDMQNEEDPAKIDGPEEEREVPMTVVEFLNAVEEPLKDEYLPDALGKTIYTSLLGTAAKLSPADNVKITLFMEMENIRIAKNRGFEGIFTTNANRLTQHVSRILDYDILRTIQINQYEDQNGQRPFQEAPDDLVTEIAVKFF